ncbi:MAG: DUF6290 family protein [Spirochaetota bacterium]
MAVISIRLNADEEKMMAYLADLYEEDKSTLIKHSLNEMYEDTMDKSVIEKFERSEKRKTPKFLSAEELLESL